nr:immunoglobulin heavy chain junction region [Mus musculus]
CTRHGSPYWYFDVW